MSDNSADFKTTPLLDSEYTVLLPTMALLSCANSRATELGGGFRWGEGRYQLEWPTEVQQGMGLKPERLEAVQGDKNVFKVFFEPYGSEPKGYWSVLFSSQAPSLIVFYEISQAEPLLLAPTDDERLQWHWNVSEDDQLLALDRAIEAHEILADQVDWLELSMRSVNENRRALLFESVATHLSFAVGE